MKLHYKMTTQEWKDLLDELTENGCHLISYPTTDNNGLFVDFKYALVEYNGMFFYMDCGDWSFKVCKYYKVSPYEKRQSNFPRAVSTSESLLQYIQTQTKCTPFEESPKQRIFLLELYKKKDGRTNLQRLQYELAGNREKEILNNLERITTVQHTKDYHVLRFHSKDGNYFDYEAKSQRITG